MRDGINMSTRIYIAILLFLSFQCVSVQCEELLDSSRITVPLTKEVPISLWGTVFFGLSDLDGEGGNGYQLSFNLQINRAVIKIEASSNKEFGPFFSAEELPYHSLYEYGIQCGYSVFKNKWINLVAAGGIAYIKTTRRGKLIEDNSVRQYFGEGGERIYEPINNSTVGLPLSLQCDFIRLKLVGIGVIMNVTINRALPVNSAGFTVSWGMLQNQRIRRLRGKVKHK